MALNQSINQSMPRRSADLGRCNYTSKLVTGLQHKLIQRSEPGPGLAWPEGRTLMGMAQHNGKWCKMEDGYSGTGWHRLEGAKTRRWGRVCLLDLTAVMPCPCHMRTLAGPVRIRKVLPPRVFALGLWAQASRFFTLPAAGRGIAVPGCLSRASSHHFENVEGLPEEETRLREGGCVPDMGVLSSFASWGNRRMCYRGPWPWNPRRGKE
jgi:hypothetical protein